MQIHAVVDCGGPPMAKVMLAMVLGG